jgi:NAD(P)-dependent dehydrogenase (short-subunit alcohol dehydrogenase family)
MVSLEFAGKRALVTGGTKGIGQAATDTLRVPNVMTDYQGAMHFSNLLKRAVKDVCRVDSART